MGVRGNLFRRAWITLAALVVSVQPAPAQVQKPAVVFAASSLQTALDAVAADWQKSTGRKVAFSYAASSALARQLEHGAPADLFASADLDWMDWAEQRKLIRPGTRWSLLGNALVLIAQKSDTVDLKIEPGFALAAAIGTSRIATGNPQSVPAGKYAKAALSALGVWDQVGPRIAGTDNVRAALTLVARGEAKFGIVYRTDANSDPDVRIVDTFPAHTHPPIVYPFAVTSNSAHPDAEAFLIYLSTPSAARIFEANGFSLLKKSAGP